VFREKNPCAVCGKSTPKSLFDDDELRIPICSYECEHRYLDTLTHKEEAKLLTRFDNRIAQTKHHLRLCWTTAAIGASVTLAGFFTRTVAVFLAGASLATLSAFLTRYLEEKTVKLTRTRRRISI
jgi:hypothetical protein